MAPPPPPDHPRRRTTLHMTLRRLFFVGALALNVAVLYAPDPGSPPGSGLGLDKLVHAGIFALLVLAGLRAALDPRWFLPAVLAHAVLSEIIQALLLPARAGDVTDAIADVAGIALGYLVHRRWPGRAVPSASARDTGG